MRVSHDIYLAKHQVCEISIIFAKLAGVAKRPAITILQFNTMYIFCEIKALFYEIYVVSTSSQCGKTPNLHSLEKTFVKTPSD